MKRCDLTLGVREIHDWRARYRAECAAFNRREMRGCIPLHLSRKWLGVRVRKHRPCVASFLLPRVLVRFPLRTRFLSFCYPMLRAPNGTHILAFTDFIRLLTQVIIKRHNSAELMLRSFAFRRGIAGRAPCNACKATVPAVATGSRLIANQGAPEHIL